MSENDDTSRQTNRDNRLKLIQVNLQGSRAATALAAVNFSKWTKDIALIQDYYSHDNKIPSFPRSWVTIESEKKSAAIVIINSKLQPTVIHVDKHFVIIQIESMEEVIQLASVYAAPSQNLSEILHKLQEANNVDFDNIVIGGDFNGKSFLWGYDQEDERGCQILDFTSAKQMSILNTPDCIPTFETMRSKGRPDLTIISNFLQHKVLDWDVLPDISLSDHKYISTDLGVATNTHENKRFKTKFGNFKKFRKVLPVVLDGLEDMLGEINSPESLDNFTRLLQDRIFQACEKTFRIKKGPCTKTFKWFTKELAIKRNRLRALHRRYLKSDDEEKQVNAEIYKRERAHYKKLLLEQKTQAWKKFCTDEPCAFGKAYKLVKNVAHQPTPELYADMKQQDQALNMNNMYLNILDKLFPNGETISPSLPHTTITEPQLSVQEITNAVYAVPKNKAPGPDQIDGIILHHIFAFNSSLFTKFYRKCYELSHFPTPLKIGRVVLFRKPGKDSRQPTSFRPICLLSVIGKVLEKIILGRIEHHIAINKIIASNQYGFREGLSTEHALQNILSRVNNNRDNKIYTAIVSIDFQGAFDSLWWPRIKELLTFHSFPPNTNQITQSFLTNRRVEILHCAGITGKDISRGCPQGSSLGPILWNLLINPLLTADFQNHTKIQAFADDVIITTTGNSRSELETNVNNSLLQICQWSETNHLSISPEKSESIIVGFPNNFKRNPVFKINDGRIKIKKQIKYLGIVIDDHLSWIPHVNHVRLKANIVAKQMFRFMSKSWGLKPIHRKIWYKGVIERIILYGASIWGLSPSSCIRRILLSIQRRFALYVTGCYRTTSTDAVLILAGLEPLDLVVEREAASARILRLQTSTIVFGKRWDHRSFENKISKWLLHPSIDNPILFTETNVPLHLRIFTDGSKDLSGVGASFCVFEKNVLTQSWKGSMSRNNSVFQAELYAIYKAIEWLIRKKKSITVIIYTDSKSSLDILKRHQTSNGMAHKIKSKLIGSDSDLCVHLSWVRAHTGVLGNELADSLAKEAARESNRLHSLLKPASFLKKTLKRQTLELWQERWSVSTKGRRTFDFFSSPSTTRLEGNPLISWFLTGHGPFQSYLFRFHLRETELCVCGDAGSPDHYLTACPITTALHIKKPNAISEQTWKEKLSKDRASRIIIFKLMKFIIDNESELSNP